ncbi:MAG: hypothetical protein OXC09_01850, partial [Truepera sp.]|nr:hypothetical protein [Truepera sp.]
RRCVPDISKAHGIGIGAGRGVIMRSEGAVLEQISPSCTHIRGSRNHLPDGDSFILEDGLKGG